MESYIVEVNNTEYEVTIRDNKQITNSKNEKIKSDHSNVTRQDSKENVKENTVDKDKEKSISTAKHNMNPNNIEGVKVNAPMTGMILSIKVQKDDIVQKNEVIITLEAMKMETEIVTPVQGKIIDILTSEGSTCKQGDTLIIIEDGGS